MRVILSFIAFTYYVQSINFDIIGGLQNDKGLFFHPIQSPI